MQHNGYQTVRLAREPSVTHASIQYLTLCGKPLIKYAGTEPGDGTPFCVTCAKRLLAQKLISE